MAKRVDIRAEAPDDVVFIRAVTAGAFARAPYSNRMEAAIVDALRQAGSLSLSLVATNEGEIVGHVAFSPVLIDGQAGDWYGLGPVSVRPDRQRQGVGQMLIGRGLEQLRGRGAEGCVVFGDPAYYGRFGFASDPDLYFPDAPPGYFLRLAFRNTSPRGEVRYHAAFG
ncbi:MAG TPA: N-acetyltransferase [Rhizomicrobium sp.]|nr:N-acetyltransferase [Rhizomicrobium sp.]